MKTKIASQLCARLLGFTKSLAPRRLAFTTALLLSAMAPMQAQNMADPVVPQYTRPSWWFGLAGAANVNFYGGSTQRLTQTLYTPIAFHEGIGVGLYGAPLVEFHKPGSILGLMFQVGYDSRRGTYNQEFSPCNCPRDLATQISYLTAEPSLRIAPFRGNFYLYIGPRAGYNLRKSFTYKQGTNPAYPEQTPVPDTKGDLDFMNQWVFSGQVGAGYDIQLSSQAHKTQWVLSPFISYQPYFGQEPRSIETATISTLRGGAAIKFGRGKLIPAAQVEAPIEMPVIVAEEPNVTFTVVAPANIQAERKVSEVFPLRNYVFFDEGSNAIPGRYNTLRKNQTKDFKEDQVNLVKPGDISRRSDRQMVVYANILNILGDRMTKNPSSTIRLVGSSPDGNQDGLEMAASVQRYLVDVWGIDKSRITLEGRVLPEVPSGPSGATEDATLLKADNRRVSIESSSPELLMEFQTGPTASLTPVTISDVQSAPLESYITFNNEGSAAGYESWRMEVVEKGGIMQNFGPYYREKVSIPGNTILGSKPEGDYTVTMIGRTRSGQEYRKSSNVHLVLWTPTVTEEVKRYSVIYEFDEAKTQPMYEQYLKEVVIPKVPAGGKVLIYGYTDIIGTSEHNETLSLQRANDVKAIIAKGLAARGTKDVTLEVHGFGEDPNLSHFDNKYPEERFYNRTVVVDIVPMK